MGKATPERFTLVKNILYPFYRRLGGPERRCGWVRKISQTTGFDPPTAQTVKIRYTEWAIAAHYDYVHKVGYFTEQQILTLRLK